MNTRYVAQATGFDLYDADENKGTAPQIGVNLTILEGPEAGKTIRYFGSLHENAQQYTAEALRAMGWSCNDITALEGLGSLKVIAVEKREEWKGKTQIRYSIFPVKTPRPTLEADSKASFAARFTALAASVKPADRTELNAGLPADSLPAPTTSTGNGTTTTGATGGAAVPF